MAKTEPTVRSKPIRVNARTESPDKSVPQVVSELWTLTVDYAKQEIRDPLKGLTNYLVWGTVSMLLMGTGMVLLALGLLRALQTETGSTFTGSLTYVPYGIVLAASVVVLGIVFFLTVKRKRGSGGKHLRED